MKNSKEINTDLMPVSLPPQVVIVDAPTRYVTVNEDRARVVRELEIDWKAGANSVFVERISVYANDSSLSVEFEAEDKPRVGNARAIRWYDDRSQSVQDKQRLFIEKLDELQQAFIDQVDRGTVIDLRRRSARQALQAGRDSIVRDVFNSAGNSPEYGKRIVALFERFEQLIDDGQNWREEFGELLERLQLLAEELEEEPPEPLKRCGLLLNFEASTKGRGKLKVGYEVPCAQWRPLHEAHLVETDGANTVRLATKAVVWQQSGEDWSGVELTVSTARPSLGLDMPLPSADILLLREKTAQERKQVRVQIRDQEIDDVGPGGNEGPGVPDDGGRTQNYVAGEKVDIPSDGRPYFAQLHSFETDCETELLSSPELNDRVFLRSRQKASGKPILAGPVEIYRKGGYVGRGFLDFAGPGSRFDLYWGSEDLAQVVRWVDTKDEKGGIVSKPSKSFEVNLLVRNIDSSPLKMKVIERIPVSELEQVEVKLEKAPDGASADDDGFIEMSVEVPPGGEHKLELKYKMVFDKNVVF
jgi:uncharacterized protein (TIGR02231 family)